MGKTTAKPVQNGLVLRPGMQIMIQGQLALVETCFHCKGRGETSYKTCCISKKTGWPHEQCQESLWLDDDKSAICCVCDGDRLRLRALVVISA